MGCPNQHHNPQPGVEHRCVSGWGRLRHPTEGAQYQIWKIIGSFPETDARRLHSMEGVCVTTSHNAI
jgi:hypothetical protein